MDQLQINGLEFRQCHGCLPAEKQIPQRFLVDVVLYLDLSAAGKTDDLSKTIDYAKIVEGIAQTMEGPCVCLIETLAERIAAYLLTAFSVREVTVTVHKPEAPIPKYSFAGVSVTIHRQAASL